MTRQVTVSLRDKLYKKIISFQSELVKETGTTWGTSQIINLICLYAVKNGMSLKDFKSLISELE